MAINLLSAVGSVSGAMYSRKMAVRAQKNFQSQLDLKRELETGKLDYFNRKLQAKIDNDKAMQAIALINAKANQKRSNTEMRDVRLRENEFKASLANNTINTMKEGEQ